MTEHTKSPRFAYTTGPASMRSEVLGTARPVRAAFESRLGVVAATLTGTAPPTLDDALDEVAEVVGHDPELLWLAQSVLSAQLPTDEDMDDLVVRARLGGTWAALRPNLVRLESAERFRDVRVVRDSVLCDVHTTAESEFLSGIQRVVRETTTRWHHQHDVEFVGWTKDLSGLRVLRDEEFQRLFGHDRPLGNVRPSASPLVVPWESTFLWVELVINLHRTGRLLALTQHSRNQVGVLGYDSIPITSPGTVAQGMTPHFSRALAAIRRADRVGLISAAAATEFRGVMEMGAGRRDPGPHVAAVPLAVTSPVATEPDLLEARGGLVVDGVPMILVVGSHEPRKNHVAILHAAELLWREGLRFNLVLLGAGSWNATEYIQVLESLVAAGRPVQSLRGLPDRLLGAAYQLAHCTLFPSLNEGFGLPVAESLAVGTPVITSNFGSMRDILAPDGTPMGGLLVDPHDDASLTDAIRLMLTDHQLHDRLRAETAEHQHRSWDTYASELWSYLVDGVRPEVEPLREPALPETTPT